MQNPFYHTLFQYARNGILRYLLVSLFKPLIRSHRLTTFVTGASPTISAGNTPVVCWGRACPARNLPPYPFHGQFVGEGFIPPGDLPAAANGRGGQRAGRPTYYPGRAADPRGIDDAAPTFIAANLTAVPPHNQKILPTSTQAGPYRVIYTPVLLPVNRHNHAGQRQQRQQVRDRHQAVEQVGQRPDKINLQG